jgi:hypothetical protein
MNKFKCMSCDYETDRLFNYKKHSLSKKHLMLEQAYIDDDNMNFDNTTYVKTKKYERTNNNDETTNKNDDLTNTTPEKCVTQQLRQSCEFCTKVISKSNIAKHHKICKSGKDVPQDIERDPQKSHCTHCLKYIHKSNMSRHCKICKSKNSDTHNTVISSLIVSDDQMVSTKLENEIVQLRKDNEKTNSELVKCMNMLTNKICNTNNNNTCNVYYVMNNCPDALDFNKLMDAPITDSELQDLNENSAIVGSINFLLKRCITDVDPRDRPFHLADESRGKYCVKLGNDWTIDMQGEIIINKLCEILKSVYLDFDKNDSPEVRMAKNNKFLDLYNNKHKILNYVKEQVLLKNNSKLMLV